MEMVFSDWTNYLEIGLSAISWCPEDVTKSEWVFVNDARCKLTGFSRAELLSISPYQNATPDSIAQLKKIITQVTAQGSFVSETTLLHKSNRVIPVIMHMSLMTQDQKQYLIVEHHDIRPFKEVEARLQRARDSAQDMLTLIEKEKKQLSKNIEDNLALVAFPLIEQMRITATDAQKEILTVLKNRIGHVTKELGIARHPSSLNANLTKRQILICEMICDGMTSKEIASALGCTASTINNHRNLIRQKLKLPGKSVNLQAFLNRNLL